MKTGRWVYGFVSKTPPYVIGIIGTIAKLIDQVGNSCSSPS